MFLPGVVVGLTRSPTLAPLLSVNAGRRAWCLWATEAIVSPCTLTERGNRSSGLLSLYNRSDPCPCKLLGASDKRRSATHRDRQVEVRGRIPDSRRSIRPQVNTGRTFWGISRFQEADGVNRASADMVMIVAASHAST